MNRPETIYLYRRKGQDAFATCDLDRYSELYGHVLFETKIAYRAPALPEGYALVPFDQLKKIHRDLDACQKLIRANMRGCDPAYYEDALVSLAHIEAMLAAAQEVE